MLQTGAGSHGPVTKVRAYRYKRCCEIFHAGTKFPSNSKLMLNVFLMLGVFHYTLLALQASFVKSLIREWCAPKGQSAASSVL